jgi:hypothetical protein
VRGLTTTILLVVVLAGLGGYIYFVEMKKPATGANTKPKAFDVNVDQIEELQIKVPGGDTTKAQRTGTDWKLVEPFQAEGNSSELTNMAANLASLDVERVIDENPTDLGQYGLNPPQIEIAFRTKAQKEPMRLLVGEKTPTGADVYAKKPDEKRVFLVSSSLNETFRRSAFDLRDKTVLKFDREKADGLEIVRTGTTVQFAKKANDWMIVKPTSMRADYGAVEGLVSTLSAASMQKVVTDNATPADLRSFGLERPTVSASVLTGSARATLLVGKTENEQTYVKDASRPMVVTIAPTSISDLTKPLNDYRRKDTFDMRSFTAKRLELKRGSETFVFEKATGKDGKDVWRNAAGKDVDTTKVEGLLTGLSNLRAQSFDDRQDPALKMPALTVAVQFGENKDENRSESVTLARSGASTIASRADEPGTMTLEGTGLDEVMKALDSLR